MLINMLLNSAGDRVELQKESQFQSLIKLKTGEEEKGGHERVVMR